MSTTIKSPGKQAGGATLIVGSAVRVTGKSDFSEQIKEHAGRVTRVVPGLDVRLRVTLGLSGGYVDTITADEIWIDWTPATEVRS